MTSETSNAHPQYFYGNPANHARFEREKNKCQGCRHEIVISLVGKMVRGCNQGKKHGFGCTLKEIE